MHQVSAEHYAGEPNAPGGDVLARVANLVADLVNVSDRLVAIGRLPNRGDEFTEATPTDGELQLLRSLTRLQDARAEIGSLEQAIRALDATIEGRPQPTEQSDSNAGEAS